MTKPCAHCGVLCEAWRRRYLCLTCRRASTAERYWKRRADALGDVPEPWQRNPALDDLEAAWRGLRV